MLRQAALLGLETQLAVRLPKLYREFLAAGDQIAIEGRWFPIRWKTNPWDTLDHCFGIQGAADLLKEWRRMATVLPPGTVPLGSTGSGDVVFIWVRGHRRGQIWFWDYYSRTRSRAVHFVASSFGRFLKSLRSGPVDLPQAPHDPWGGPTPRHRVMGLEVPQTTGLGDKELRAKRRTSIGVVAACGRRLREGDIRQLEGAVGVGLPRGYRSFLKQCNGGMPACDMFRCRVGRDWVWHELSHFYGWRRRRRYDDIIAWRRALRRLLPSDVLAIGCAVGEDQVVIGVGEGNSGRLMLWDAHGRGAGAGRMMAIAESWDGFARMLREGAR
jgi:hypothetical protein